MEMTFEQIKARISELEKLINETDSKKQTRIYEDEIDVLTDLLDSDDFYDFKVNNLVDDVWNEICKRNKELVISINKEIHYSKEDLLERFKEDLLDYGINEYEDSDVKTIVDDLYTCIEEHNIDNICDNINDYVSVKWIPSQS